MHTAVAGLVEGTLENFIAETIALDIHLRGRDTVACAGNLEVHVAEVVLVSENIAKNSVFGALVVMDKTHCDAADGFLHLHACIEQSEGACAYGGH